MENLQQNNQPKNGIDFNGKYVVNMKTGLVKELEIKHIISQYGVKNTTFLTIQELS
jgi:hypothetical protein